MRSSSLRFSLAAALLLLSSAATAQNPTTSSYLYLTEIENTIFNEAIKFWYQDTLDGPVHSNDTIALQGGGPPGGPVFLDSVSTSAPVFNYWGTVTPYFAYPPVFNAPRMALPERADSLRAWAASQGNFFSDENGQLAYRLNFYHNGTAKLFRWPLGSMIDTVLHYYASFGLFNWGAIFVDGYLEVQGLVRGTISVGAHGSTDPADTGYHCIKLINDIRYASSDPINGQFDPSISDMIQIVSEGDIVIGNTWANGKNNGWNVSNHNPDSSSIIITAALVALGESFTFEDQNDTFIWEYSRGFVGPTPDDRGKIYLRGSLAQRRRGYVHRSNHSGTGYSKHYYHDARMDTMQFPGSIRVGHIPVFDPPQVNFGLVPIYHTDTLNLILHNQGGTYIEMQSAHTIIPIFGVLPVDSTTLSPGDSFTFRVTFHPLALVDYHDTLTVELYYGADLKVALNGTGSAVGVHSEAMPANYGIRVYPNPFNGQLRIESGSCVDPTALCIRDIQGRVVEAAKLDGGVFTWKPANLAGGIYFLTLSNMQETISRKVVFLK